MGSPPTNSTLPFGLGAYIYGSYQNRGGTHSLILSTMRNYLPSDPGQRLRSATHIRTHSMASASPAGLS
ncbi:hypothetical protein NJ75_04431 [Novosphingobium subterraneum]|uniref:Uncharacterized protein n=1 Tax=Novosphingobium subterraneum TaxID=48936 RepID=A0A0B8ZGD7_9SPHN|nr:hypothetical protein NJ75_04431 [Novosphingobium subterraneum]